MSCSEHTAVKILIVEDNPVIGEGILAALSGQGATCELVDSLGSAKTLAAGYDFDIVVLDLNLPDGYGLDLLPLLQAKPAAPSILILTAQDSVTDRVEGLDAGADDYLVKPFEFEELLARVRVLERRRHGRSKTSQLDFAHISLLPASFDARIGDEQVKLSRREFAGLKLLMENAETVVTKEQMIDQLYQPDEPPLANAIEVLVSRLRKRIAGSNAELKTIRGVGYILVEEDAAP